MDPAAYTLLGALGGVVITQVANYLLEEKRVKHRREDEKESHKRTLSSDLRSRRQDAYAMFLAEFDYWCGYGKKDRVEQMLKHFYGASVICSDRVMPKLGELVHLAQNDEPDDAKLMQLKAELVFLMRNELTQ